RWDRSGDRLLPRRSLRPGEARQDPVCPLLCPVHLCAVFGCALSYGKPRRWKRSPDGRRCHCGTKRRVLVGCGDLSAAGVGGVIWRRGLGERGMAAEVPTDRSATTSEIVGAARGDKHGTALARSE